MRRSHGRRARLSRVSTTASRGSTCASARARTSARSRTRSAATAATLRRTEVGPFSRRGGRPASAIAARRTRRWRAAVSRRRGSACDASCESQAAARSRSGPSTASTSATGGCSTPRSRPGRRRRSSPSTRIRAWCSATRVELLATLERRLELLAEAGIEDDARRRVRPRAGAALEPRGVRRARACGRSAPRWSSRARTSASATAARATSTLLARPRLRRRAVPLVEGVSSTPIRDLLRAASDGPQRCSAGRPRSTAWSSRATRAAARSASRPRTSRPTRAARPRLRHLRRRRGGHRAAVSIGVNPHYGGDERRIEAFLLDFDGRPLRRAAGRRAVAAPPRRAGLRERGRAGRRRSPATSTTRGRP